jgi:hypothetical protein
MTEQEWLDCADPKPMLDFLRGQTSERKLRLFACACVRRAWHLLSDTGRQAVGTAEAYADGMTDTEALRATSCAAHKPVDDAIEAANSSYLGFDLGPALSAADAAFEASSGMDSDITRHLVPLNAARAAQDALGGRTGSEPAAQAALVRDVCGNPFKPCRPLPPSALAWSHGTALRIARGIYNERPLHAATLDAGRLAILADALLDAGCDDEELIAHCRSAGPHVRGCWAVDLILGKE